MLRLRRRLCLVLPLLLGASTGCRAFVDLLDGEKVATVKLFGTHAGSPVDGTFQTYGEAGTTRVFTNDQGWEVSLDEIYVTTAEVSLVECGKDSGTPIEMFWGPCAEDFIATDDRQTIALGAVTVPDGEYCGLDVTFGPYVTGAGAEDHAPPNNPMVEGKSLLVRGIARRGEGAEEEQIPIELTSEAVVSIRLDISTLEAGGPVTLFEENFARNLTVVKTYDTFFAGIDFSTATNADIEAAILAALEFDTVPFDGTTY